MRISVLDHGYVELVETWGEGRAGEAEAGIMRLYNDKAALVWGDVTDAYMYDGRAVDSELFEEIAERHGLKKTVAAEMYYSIKARFQQPAKKLPAKSKNRRNYKNKRGQ